MQGTARTGRRWGAEDAVLEAEARLGHKTLVGVVRRGRVGLVPAPKTNHIRGKVQEEVRASVEEKRSGRALKQRGAEELHPVHSQQRHQHEHRVPKDPQQLHRALDGANGSGAEDPH